MTAAI